MASNDDEDRVRPSTAAATAALVLACIAITLGLLAAPGGLVWLTIWLPGVHIHDEGAFAILANVVTIPAALLSWLLAVACCAVAAVAVRRRRGGRRAVLALSLSAPGTVFGTVLVVAVASQLGTSLGIFPGSADARRQTDVRAVAAHLVLPARGSRLISRCESKDGMFQQQRIFSVLEPWSQPRVDQIGDRLLDYRADSSFVTTSPSDREQIYFSGTDTRGNSIIVYVDRFPAGTRLTLGCGHLTLPTAAIRTVISLEDGDPPQH